MTAWALRLCRGVPWLRSVWGNRSVPSCAASACHGNLDGSWDCRSKGSLARCSMENLGLTPGEVPTRQNGISSDESSDAVCPRDLQELLDFIRRQILALAPRVPRDLGAAAFLVRRR